MKVDKATIDDIPAIIELGRMMHEESDYASLDFSAAKIELLLQGGVNEFGGVFLRVIRQGDELIGGLLGVITEYWFSDTDKLAQDLALFVRPDRRGAVASRLLIGEFKHWARENGAKEVAMSITTGVTPERTSKLFELCGLPRVGAVHKVEV